MANLDKSHFVRLVHFFSCMTGSLCTTNVHEFAFPENVIASALHHGAECQKNRDNACADIG